VLPDPRAALDAGASLTNWIACVQASAARR
jgi:hypothetical protein